MLQRSLTCYFALAAGFAAPSTQSSQSVADELVSLSRLSIAGLRCSVLAPNEKERERLLQIGLNSGRRFYESLNKWPEEIKPRWTEIPGSYLRVSGPSVDFLVGRVYGHVEEEIFGLQGNLCRDFMPIHTFVNQMFSCGVAALKVAALGYAQAWSGQTPRTWTVTAHDSIGRGVVY